MKEAAKPLQPGTEAWKRAIRLILVKNCDPEIQDLIIDQAEVAGITPSELFGSADEQSQSRQNPTTHG